MTAFIITGHVGLTGKLLMIIFIFHVVNAQFQVMQQGQKIYQAFVDAGLMQMTSSEIEALIINLWIVLTNWTNFLYMSGHIVDSNHLEEKWVWQALRQMVFLEGAYLRGESRATYEHLMETFGPSELFASLSASRNNDTEE